MSFPLLSLVIFSSLSFITITQGFTTDIIHRNSPHSPFYNASATVGDLSTQAARSSLQRSRNYAYADTKIQSTLIPGTNSYLMRISVGTPPLENIYAEIDTGSDLVWIQCYPCPNCYPSVSPTFYAHHSSSYKNVGCISQPCYDLSMSYCGGTTNTLCVYRYTYADKSYTNGELATDTFTFNSSTLGRPRAQLPNIVFGCGHNNSGLFPSRGSGLVGLGRGNLSLVSQLGTKRFSYCLLPETSPSNSKIKFGMDADIISQDGRNSIVSTPLLSRPNIPTGYFLNLEGVTVGNHRIQNNDETAGGNTLIDSGTTLTVLIQPLYNDVEASVRGIVGLNSVQHPNGYYHLCYETTESSGRIRGVTMIFHFTDADLTLNSTNLFRDGGYGLTCLSVIPSDAASGDISIFGNQAQINFQIEYDLARSTVSFLPTDCTSIG